MEAGKHRAFFPRPVFQAVNSLCLEQKLLFQLNDCVNQFSQALVCFLRHAQHLFVHGQLHADNASLDLGQIVLHVSHTIPNVRDLLFQIYLGADNPADALLGDQGIVLHSLYCFPEVLLIRIPGGQIFFETELQFADFLQIAGSAPDPGNLNIFQQAVDHIGQGIAVYSPGALESTVLKHRQIPSGNGIVNRMICPVVGGHIGNIGGRSYGQQQISQKYCQKPIDNPVLFH